MATNYVELLVKARDTATPEMDDLKARLAELSGKVATARATVDDEAGAAKLDDMQARLLRLQKTTANPKISMDGALKAEAQIHAVEDSLNHLNDSSGETKSRFGALAGVLNTLTLGMSGGIGEMSMLQKVMLGLNLATGVGEPLVAGLTVAVGAMAASAASAGGALGAFGIIAETSIEKAGTAATAAQAAQTAYTAAVKAANTTYAQSMAKATTASEKQNAQTARASALQTALAAKVTATSTAYSGMTTAQVQMSKQIGGIESQWQSFTASFAPMISKVIGQVRPLITALLPDFKKLADAGETGITTLLSAINGAGTGGITKFVNMLANNAPAAIVRFGTAIGNVAKGIGGILKAFMPMSSGILTGLDKLTAKFASWGSSLGSHSGFQSLMQMFRQDTPLVAGDLKKIAELIKTVVSNMAGMSTFSNSKMLLQALSPILSILNQLAKVPGLVPLLLYLKLASDSAKKLKVAFTGVQDGLGFLKTAKSGLSDLKTGLTDSEAAAQDGASAWTVMGGRIGTAVTAIKNWGIWSKIASAATKVWTGVQAAFDAVMDANPIAIIIIAIAALVAAIVICTVKFQAFRDFWKDAWKVIEDAAVVAWQFIDNDMIRPLENGIADVVNFIKDHWKTLATILATVLLGPVAGLVVFIATHWTEFRNLTSKLVSDVVNFFESLPGKILAALKALPGELLNLGKDIIEGLIHGIEDAAGGLLSTVKNLAGDVTGAFKDVLGIFSPSKVFYQHGADIVAGLVQGIDASAGQATSAMRKLGLSGLPSGTGGYGALGMAGAGGTGQLKLTLDVQGTSGDPLTEWLREQVRVKGGGNIQQAFGYGGRA